jgi:ferredoxin
MLSGLSAALLSERRLHRHLLTLQCERQACGTCIQQIGCGPMLKMVESSGRDMQAPGMKARRKNPGRSIIVRDGLSGNSV